MSDEGTAEDRLRLQVRHVLQRTGLSQAEVARQIGCSTKHLNQMLIGSATLTLAWAEGILGLAGHTLVITTRKDP